MVARVKSFRAKIIYDKDITLYNYASFGSCHVIQSGKKIRFTMAGGSVYDVSLDYLMKWNKEPHYIYLSGKWIDWNRSMQNIKKVKDLMIIRCRRIASNTAVRIYLNNNIAYDVPWDTVLMACEKNYEHFGGLTNESIKITRKYHRMDCRN